MPPSKVARAAERPWRAPLDEEEREEESGSEGSENDDSERQQQVVWDAAVVHAVAGIEAGDESVRLLTPLRPCEAALLTGALRLGRCVAHLELRDSALGDEGAALLASALAACPRLEFLGMPGNGLSAVGAGALLREAPPALSTLDLSDNPLGAGGGAALGAALSRSLRRLAVLDLGCCALGPDGAASVLAALGADGSGHGALTALDLRRNALGAGAGLDALLAALCANTSLVVLNCDDNALGPGACPRALEALRRAPCSALEQLSLDGNAARSDDLAALDRWLAHNATAAAAERAAAYALAAGQWARRRLSAAGAGAADSNALAATISAMASAPGSFAPTFAAAHATLLSLLRTRPPPSSMSPSKRGRRDGTGVKE